MNTFYDSGVLLIEKWVFPKGYRSAVIIILIATLIIFSGGLVYATGGIRYVYAHTMYIPILLGALFFRIPGGLIVAILGGLVLGPYMPLNMETGEMQATANWLYRMGMFSLIGASAGMIVRSLEIQINRFRWYTYHHPDSGLPNRTFLITELHKMIAKYGINNEHGVLIVHLNNYSEIANTFGIEAVEQLVNELNRRLQVQLKGGAIGQLLSHILGVVVFGPEMHSPENIRVVIDITREPIYLETVPIFLDISVGVAIYPLHSENPSILLRKAMIASDTARNKGLDYYIYDFARDENSLEKITLVGSVPKALENNEFFLHYQPIVDLSTGKAVGMEALIRWQHPEKGLIPPIDFLPYLENTSLIYQVQDYVVDTAIRQQEIWFQNGWQGIICINISVRGLNNPLLIDNLKKTIEQVKMNHFQVIYEITETVLIIDPIETISLLEKLHNFGIALAIDDFGSGYSSLSYLRSLPIDYVKIDREFIKNLAHSKKDQEIVRAAFSLCKALNLKVIAEGVEMDETYQWLKAEGCDYAQGYGISRPMPVDMATNWLYSQNNHNGTHS